MVDQLRAARRRAETLLDETVAGVVVDDLGGACLVDRDREEVGQVAISALRYAVRAEEADRVVVHGPWSGLDLGHARGGAGDCAGRVDRIRDLRHVDVPGLTRLCTRVAVAVGAIPHGVGAAGSTRLDPGE